MWVRVTEVKSLRLCVDFEVAHMCRYMYKYVACERDFTMSLRHCASICDRLRNASVVDTKYFFAAMFVCAI